MSSVFFNVLFKIIGVVADIALFPANTIISTLFPNFTQIVYDFTLFVNTYVTSTLSYFFYMLPPKTKYVLLFYLTYLPVRYVAILNYHLILKVFRLIKNIKIW